MYGMGGMGMMNPMMMGRWMERNGWFAFDGIGGPHLIGGNFMSGFGGSGDTVGIVSGGGG